MSCGSSFRSRPPAKAHWSAEIGHSCLSLPMSPFCDCFYGVKVSTNGCWGLLLYPITSPPVVLRLSALVGSPPLLTSLDSELRFANVLIDDITDAKLLLLLHPHQLHTLVDKNVLLLGQKTKPCFRARDFHMSMCKDTIFWYYDSSKYCNRMSKETIFIMRQFYELNIQENQL